MVESTIGMGGKVKHQKRAGHEHNLLLSNDQCHVKLPWVNCQRQPPSQAPLLHALRSEWSGERHLSDGSPPTGPLLLFPDTSALLTMLGAQSLGEVELGCTLDTLQVGWVGVVVAVG